MGRECRQVRRIHQEVQEDHPLDQALECRQVRHIRREAQEDRLLAQAPGCGQEARRPTVQALECSPWKSRFL